MLNKKKKTKSQFFDVTFQIMHILIYFRFEGPHIIGIVFTVVSWTFDELSSVVNVKPFVNVGNSPKIK